MSACPDKELLLHALVDGELEAIRAVKARLAAAPLAYRAPGSLLDRLDAALDEAERPPARRRIGPETWALGGGMGAIAASLALFALVPTGASLQAQLVDAQARSLEASHLVDVETSDRHTVKPWFNGKVDFAPPVVDLKPQGYPLVGGRLDRLDGRRVAALVFHRQAHVINLFVWPGETSATPSLQQKDGYNLVRWGHGGLTFWAVSDCDAAALTGFQQAFAAATK